MAATASFMHMGQRSRSTFFSRSSAIKRSKFFDGVLNERVAFEKPTTTRINLKEPFLLEDSANKYPRSEKK
ncbi:unnamed protein product [Rotaria magnacalcarata]